MSLVRVLWNADSGNVNQPAADVGNTLHFDDMPNFNPP